MIIRAAGEARKTTAAATSSRAATVPRGTMSITNFRDAGSAGIGRVSDVSTKVGATELTRIPRGANSTALAFVTRNRPTSESGGTGRRCRSPEPTRRFRLRPL